MTDLSILIPAAGASRRMRGSDKLLETVAGLPLLRHQVVTALPLGPVLVTLRPGDEARRAAVAGLPVTVIEVVDAGTGLSASFRAAAAQVTTALMVLPADMPDLTTADLTRLATAFRAAPGVIHRGAAQDGTPGHPVILPATLLPDIALLTGDTGARGLIATHGATLVPLPDQHALTDLDTPEDWAAWRSTR